MRCRLTIAHAVKAEFSLTPEKNERNSIALLCLKIQ